MASQPLFFATSIDLVDAEVALGRGRGADGVGLVGHAHVERGAIDVGVDGDGGDAHLVERAGDADGDLAAVRDEDLLEGAGWHGRHRYRGSMARARLARDIRCTPGT